MKENQSEIYLAGGCFWGCEKFFGLIQGVIKTEVGYANGNIENPSYQAVCTGTTGFAETVKVIYDQNQVSLPFLLKMYFDIIDPFSLNRQGNDQGTQYRTGIYYLKKSDEPVIRDFVKMLELKLGKKIVTEVLALENYYAAESYHQDYLKNNPGGYCHIGKEKYEKAKVAVDESIKAKVDLKETLSAMQYHVTQENGTEPPFKNAYYDLFEEGIYVDIISGEALFVSSDKFESGCGWPAFSKPITKAKVKEKRDSSHGMTRIEIRSEKSDAHLGHVFHDGKVETGGLRYCINSAALKFIPKAEMKKQGYEEYLDLLK